MGVADIRWFAFNQYEQLVLPDLARLGLTVDTSGDAPAGIAVCMNHDLAPAVWRYSRRHGTAFVSYVWDLPPFRLGGGRPDHVVSVGRRLLTLPRLATRYRTRRGYYSRLRYVAAHALAVWTPSRASAQGVGSAFGLAAEPVPYCYDSRLFTPDLAHRRSSSGQRRETPDAPLVLLSVSRLTAPKNHLAVIRAAARLGARVELVGRGPMQPELESLARHLGVPCRIRSGLPGDELVAAYQSASVVVCPSRFEGLGLTGIEGAISGTPVVASDIPAHREFLGAAACFFPLDDDDALVRAIEQAAGTGPPPTAHFTHLTIDAAARRFAARLSALL